MPNTYNGWSNSETWLINLWLNNDQVTYNFVDSNIIDRQLTTYNNAERLKNYVYELAEREQPGITTSANFVTDLFSRALSDVNFYEIVDHWMEEDEERGAFSGTDIR